MLLTTFLEKIRLALQTPLCLHCGKVSEREAPFCGRCHDRLNISPPAPMFFNNQSPACRIYAASILNALVKRWVYGYKFYNRASVEQLSGLLIHYWRSLPQKETANFSPERVWVTSIPPHDKQPDRVGRFAQRFARRFGYDYRENLLTWVRPVGPQHRIFERRARFANIAKGLRLCDPLPNDCRRLIVVDDIMTTGATLMEAGRAVAEGAGNPVEVIGLAVTHVPTSFGGRRSPL